MNALLHSSAAGLDRLRARLLRLTLGSQLLRRVFLDRALRLLVFFVAFELVALALCTFIPVWQLLLGPLLYGYAHLISSVRYVHHGVSADPPQLAFSRRWLPLAGLIGIYAVYRLLRLDIGGGAASEWVGFWVVQAVFVALSAGALVWAARLDRNTVLSGAFIVVPLCVLLWTEPRLTIAALAFGHNFVAKV